MNTYKKRPWYLTLFLVLAGIAFLLLAITVYFTSPDVLNKVYGIEEAPSWYIYGTLLLLLLSLVGVFLVLKWKKSGIYLIAGASLISLIIDFIVIPQDFSGVILTLLPPALIYIAALPVWEQFN